MAVDVRLIKQAVCFCFLFLQDDGWLWTAPEALRETKPRRIQLLAAMMTKASLERDLVGLEVVYIVPLALRM
jgi:hypothetical protein